MTSAQRFAWLRPYLLSLGLEACALALQWLIYPFVGPRVPFLFTVLALPFISFYCGRGPAALAWFIGAMNAVIQFDPIGAFAIADRPAQAAMFIYAFVGVVVIAGGVRVRALYRRAKQSEQGLIEARGELHRQIADLEQLHELSAKLPLISELPQQLSLILSVLVPLHSARQGLVSLYDPLTGKLSVIANCGFDADGLQQCASEQGPDSICGATCLRGERVIVRDIETEPTFQTFREFSRRENIRSVHCTPLKSHSGEVLGAITVYFPEPREPQERELRLADICARKAAVFIDRARAAALAADSDRRFRAVLEASAAPFTILKPVRNERGTIVDFAWAYLNAAATRVIGRRPEEVIGKRIGDVQPSSWNDPGLLDRYIAVAERDEVREFEILSTGLASGRWFHVVASPLEGNVAIWFADITERKRQEQELRKADRLKDEFLATLAHELRNPLAPIRQAAAVARHPSATDSQKQWCQQVIDRQVHHMGLLLDDLLDMSRITRGTLQLRRQITPLRTVIDAALETARPLIDSKRHTLNLDVPMEPVQLDIDTLRLSQVLTNLLTNAAKYTNPEGTLTLTINVVETGIELRVTDNGIGMTTDELTSIFTMFSQVKSAQERSEGGLGIGLALTRGLVQLHGGSIEASSAGIGLGSSFVVRIPNVVVDGATSGSRRGGGERPSLSRTILVADDNQDAAQSLAMLLEIDDHRVTLAANGEEAFERFQKYRPDVVLLDLGMPRLNGYEVAKKIRADGGGGEVLLIAITGWGQSTDRERSSAAGFDHHLTKPLDYSELAKLLEPSAHHASLAAVAEELRT